MSYGNLCMIPQFLYVLLNQILVELVHATIGNRDSKFKSQFKSGCSTTRQLSGALRCWQQRLPHRNIFQDLWAPSLVLARRINVVSYARLYN